MYRDDPAVALSLFDANREALAEQQARSGELLPALVAATGREPRECERAGCHNLFVPRDANHVCCGSVCRKAHWRESNRGRERRGELRREAEHESTETVRSLLYRMGEEERSVSLPRRQPDDPWHAHRESKRQGGAGIVTQDRPAKPKTLKTTGPLTLNAPETSPRGEGTFVIPSQRKAVRADRKEEHNGFLSKREAFVARIHAAAARRVARGDEHVEVHVPGEKFSGKGNFGPSAHELSLGMHVGRAQGELDGREDTYYEIPPGAHVDSGELFAEVVALPLRDEPRDRAA